MKIWINRAGQNIGTFTLAEVQRGLNQGQFVPTDLAWQEGMETWKPLAEFAELQMPAPQAPASLPPSAPLSPDVPPPLTQDTLARVEGAEDGPAWERRKELGFVKALLETWKEVLFNPAVSFSRMKTTGGLYNAALVQSDHGGHLCLLYDDLSTASSPGWLAARQRQRPTTGQLPSRDLAVGYRHSSTLG